MSADILDFFRGQRVLRAPVVHRNSLLRLRAQGVVVGSPFDAWSPTPEPEAA